MAIEVKAGGRHRVSRSLRSFIGAYAPRLALLATGGLEASRSERVGDTEVVHVPLVDLEQSVIDRLPPIA